LELTLADAYHHTADDGKAKYFLLLAEQRKQAIIQYCWSAEEKFFFDYDFVNRKQKRQLTLAAAFPLFFNVASHTQAIAVESRLMNSFLKTGGLTTTLDFSGQQWDAPNGWAPLQWIAYKGLLNYGFTESAEKVKTRWTSVNLKVYKNSGKMTEKYDVWNQNGEASGGEYPNQDGFGWTNGVFLAMMA
jgi:alpha,alpha-trehalase